jgi:GTP-binding protein YchF
MMQCGIVGLPNVGKSTLFNALTASAMAEAANYPFCTIDPNIGSVYVPDARLSRLAEIAKSKDILPTQIQFVDIAGLVKGASQGEGLGNQFLSHIRQVDVILHVVRAFTGEKVIHVQGVVNPMSDIDVIETELLLSDLQSAERQLLKKHKGDKQDDVRPLLERAKDTLSHGIRLLKGTWTEDELKQLKQLGFLTAKPMIYLVNISESDLISGGFPYREEIYAHAGTAPVVMVSTQLESEIAQLSLEDRAVFMQELNITQTGLEQVIRQVYATMDLISFFTVGPKEARAWTVRRSAKAPEAAGCIHTDFERGFIRAEVVQWSDYIEYSGEAGAKAVGRVATEGKEYVVQDGDVMLFRFNV